MKNFSAIAILAIILISGPSCKNSKEGSARGESEIVFDSVSYNFGIIDFASDANYEFVFRNSGEGPLLLTHVKSTCGCTVPEWSREPVPQGETGKIRVSYDTHRVGVFTKSIYVYSNAGNGVQRLIISGKVEPADRNI